MDSVEITLLFAGASTICYGLVDAVAKSRIKQESARELVLMTFAIGIVLSIAGIAIAEPAVPEGLFSLGVLVPITFSSIIFAFGCHTFYGGLRTGRVSILSPLSGIQGPIAAMLAVLFFGESPSAVLIFAVALASVGTVLSGMSRFNRKELRRTWHSKELWIAILSAIAYGLSMFIDAFNVHNIGIFWALLLTDAIALVFLVVAFGYRFKMPLHHAPIGGTVMAVLEWIGDASYNAAILVGLTSLAAPISSSYPAISAVIGITFLREKISKTQIFGILLVLGAIILASTS